MTVLTEEELLREMSPDTTDEEFRAFVVKWGGGDDDIETDLVELLTLHGAKVGGGFTKRHLAGLIAQDPDRRGTNE